MILNLLSPIQDFCSLDKVLDLALSDRFQLNPPVQDSMYIALSLTSLATGSRISEPNACLRGEEFLEFSNLVVTLFPNPIFLGKNECPMNRRVLCLFLDCLVMRINLIHYA